MEPFRIDGDRLLVLDQTALPREERWIEIGDAQGMADAIARLRVRGAPAIGIAAALGLWVEARRLAAEGGQAIAPARRASSLRAAGALIRSARPTAVNLAWAADRVLRGGEEERGSGRDVRSWVEGIRREAFAIWEEDREASRNMARWGASLFPSETRFLTHCHTGGLATGGGGTALGVLLALHRTGRGVSVWATETRPLLQGARITAWELLKEGVPVTLLTDGAAAHVMSRAAIQAVLTGADRIARNGDVANKVGTLPLALAARERGIPLVVVAPTSTIDPECPDGESIPIEEREAAEVLSVQGIPVAPAGVEVENPAFDVTPRSLITAIVTERGIHRGPEFRLAEVDTTSKSR